MNTIFQQISSINATDWIKSDLKWISQNVVFGIKDHHQNIYKWQCQHLIYLAQEQDGFVEFVLQKARFDDGKRPSVHFNEPMPAFAVCNSGRGFLQWKEQEFVDDTGPWGRQHGGHQQQRNTPADDQFELPFCRKPGQTEWAPWERYL